MSSAIAPFSAFSGLEQMLSSILSAPRKQSGSSGIRTSQLQETDGLFGDQGGPAPLISPLSPGAPNINPSNALEAVDALLLGFTPTSSVIKAPPIEAAYNVGADRANPSVNVLA